MSYSFDGLPSHMIMATFSTKTFVHKVASSMFSNYQSTTVTVCAYGIWVIFHTNDLLQNFLWKSIQKRVRMVLGRQCFNLIV